jgi:membrane protein YqaA with SNARE-associated domain
MLQEIFKNLTSFGYLGIFLITLIGYSTILFPLPTAIFVFSAAGFLNPWLLAISAGLGSAFGEMTGYVLGFGGRKLILKKEQIERLEKITNILKKRRTFFAVLFLASLPFFGGDILGISAGFLKYDFKKFFLASFIGKTILHLAIAFSGFFGISWIKNLIMK